MSLPPPPEAEVDPRMDCQECGQNVAVAEHHDYIDCLTYKATVRGLPLTRSDTRTLAGELARYRQKFGKRLE